MYNFTDELVDNYYGGNNDIFNTKPSSLRLSQKISRIHPRHIMVKRSPGKNAGGETIQGEKKVRFKTPSPSPPPSDPVPSAPPPPPSLPRLPSPPPGSSLFDNTLFPLDLGPSASPDFAFGISSGSSAADSLKHSSPPNRSPSPSHLVEGTKSGQIIPMDPNLLGSFSFGTVSNTHQQEKFKEQGFRRILTPKSVTQRRGNAGRGKLPGVPRPGDNPLEFSESINLIQPSLEISDDESPHTTISGNNEGARKKQLTSKSTAGSDDPGPSSLFAPSSDRKLPLLRWQEKVIQRLTYFKVFQLPLLFPLFTLRVHSDAYSRPPKGLLWVTQILVGVSKQHQS